MTIRLRAHHLLCLLTYVGEGYTPAFTRNFDAIARRIAGGEAIRIVAGSDAVCAPLLDECACHCLDDRVRRRDRLAAIDIETVLRRSLAPGERLRLDACVLAVLRRAFRDKRIRRACQGCEWKALCSAVAEDGYARARIH